MNRLLPFMKRFSTSGIMIRKKEVFMTHKSRLAALGAAAALVSAVLLIAPTDSYPKKPKDDDSSKSAKEKSRTQHYKATICADGKVFGGGPKNTPACKAGFTTVSGQVTYDGKKAKASGQPTCLPSSSGPSNKVTWCGVANNEAGGPNHFMSLGANGQVEATGDISAGLSGGAPVGKKGAGEVGGSFGAGRQIVQSRAYWMRIDVRPNGTYNLRGGLNK